MLTTDEIIETLESLDENFSQGMHLQRNAERMWANVLNEDAFIKLSFILISHNRKGEALTPKEVADVVMHIAMIMTF